MKRSAHGRVQDLRREMHDAGVRRSVWYQERDLVGRRASSMATRGRFARFMINSTGKASLERSGLWSASPLWFGGCFMIDEIETCTQAFVDCRSRRVS
jgi:hypothetical protein